MNRSSPFDKFIERQGVCILDGGLASELEYAGHDLRHPLWSAKVLMSDPGAIRDVHVRFLNSGADCITTASYQISYPGCRRLGLSENETTSLLEKSIEVALDARTAFLKQYSGGKDRLKPLVAASIGPYGAFLTDGSEYTGNYPIGEKELYDFHAPRWEVFQKTQVDLLACETIPSYEEAKVLYQLILQSGEKPVYISFSCQDGIHINDGTPIKECIALFDNAPKLIGVGVNCTSPIFIESLIDQLKTKDWTGKTIVYPNSGEIYNGQSRQWEDAPYQSSIAELAQGWLDRGAQVIGGCCRTRPSDILKIRKALLSSER